MIYFLQRADGAIKIGTTTQYHARLYALSLEFGKLNLLGLMDGDRSTERQIHRMFPDTRIEGSEWFLESNELLEYIRLNTHLSLPPIPLKVQSPRTENIVQGRVCNRLIELIENKQQTEQRLIKPSRLAEEVGISRITMCAWIDGTVDRFDGDTITKLCKYFGCDMPDLLYIDWEAVQ